MCASLAEAPSFITAPLMSADTITAIQVLRRLGVSIEEEGQTPLVLKVTPPRAGLLSFESCDTIRERRCRSGLLNSTLSESRAALEDTAQSEGSVEAEDGVESKDGIKSEGSAESKNGVKSEDTVQSEGSAASEAALTLHLGNSGSLLYFLGMILSASHIPICLTGDESLKRRPVEPLAAVYRQAGIPYSAGKPNRIAVPDTTCGGITGSPCTIALSGADNTAGLNGADCSNGCIGSEAPAVLPLCFRGPLPAGTYRLTGPFSQPVTGLLFTAPLLNGTTRIVFNRPGERPYLKMTCDWLRTAGITVTDNGHYSFEIKGRQPYRSFSKTIPGDWSSALFPLTAAVICNTALTLTHLDPVDSQGDVRALSVLQAMGADIRCDEERCIISVRPISGGLTGGNFDCADIPDAVPALAAAALFCSGETRLVNAGVCRFKECDRLRAITEELTKFGAHITEGADFLHIEGSGGSGLHPARVCSRNDHRIAMMLAVAACGIAKESHTGRTYIKDCDCINISYPHFAEDMNAIGAAFKSITCPSE